MVNVIHVNEQTFWLSPAGEYRQGGVKAVGEDEIIILIETFAEQIDQSIATIRI